MVASDFPPFRATWGLPWVGTTREMSSSPWFAAACNACKEEVRLEMDEEEDEEEAVGERRRRCRALLLQRLCGGSRRLIRRRILFVVRVRTQGCTSLDHVQRICAYQMVTLI